LAGLVVTGTYSDSTTKPESVTTANITGYNKNTAAPQTLTVTVNGKTATFGVTVTAGSPAFVAVSSITNVPANGVTGVPVDLTVATPTAGATNTTIAWSVIDPDTTGVASGVLTGGTFTAAAGGTLQVRATIANGATATTPYIQNFDIIIIRPVDNIIGISATSNVYKDTAVSLSGVHATPTGTPGTTGASKQNIVWSVKTPGAGITAISGTSFTPATTGSLVLTATIINGSAMGTDFTRDFTFYVNEKGSSTGDFGFGDDTTIVLYGNGSTVSTGTTVPVAKNAVYELTVSGYDAGSVKWYLNGTLATVGGNGTKLILDTSKTGTVRVTVEAKKDGVVDTGTYTFNVYE
jgi:hypothetical protein